MGGLNKRVSQGCITNEILKRVTATLPNAPVPDDKVSVGKQLVAQGNGFRSIDMDLALKGYMLVLLPSLFSPLRSLLHPTIPLLLS